MFKNALILRIESWDPPERAAIEERAQRQRFVACGASQGESAGWVEPRGKAHGALLEQLSGHALLNLCVERKPVPASAVKDVLEQRLDKIEADTGRRPRGKRLRRHEMKGAFADGRFLRTGGA